MTQFPLFNVGADYSILAFNTEKLGFIMNSFHQEVLECNLSAHRLSRTLQVAVMIRAYCYGVPIEMPLPDKQNQADCDPLDESENLFSPNFRYCKAEEQISFLIHQFYLHALDYDVPAETINKILHAAMAAQAVFGSLSRNMSYAYIGPPRAVQPTSTFG